MLIPLEDESVLLLANVIALYRSENGTVILRRDGSTQLTYFSPANLKKRGEKIMKEFALSNRRKN